MKIERSSKQLLLLLLLLFAVAKSVKKMNKQRTQRTRNSATLSMIATRPRLSSSSRI